MSEQQDQNRRGDKYRRYRARPGFLIRLTDGKEAAKGRLGSLKANPESDADRGRSPVTFKRILKYLAVALTGWLLLSFALFMISAQIQSGKTPDDVKQALDPGGFTFTSANTVLILGTDERPASSKEPGANQGPSRADTIMLMRVGAGKKGRLSIPRDTVVEIPGQGQNKINAAYAIGGPELMINTVKSYLGIEINHLIEVDLANFPDLIDALGGVTVTTGCVISRINGGFKNGGFTLRLKPGKHKLNGKEALALARTRKNDCRKSEDDLTRAKRQQQILAAMKNRFFSPTLLPRMPWVAWQTPRAFTSDMSGPALSGVIGNLIISGSGSSKVLKPSGAITLPDGGLGLTVSDQERQAAVDKFLE